MNQEYQFLREEIQEWQNRRIAIFTSSVAVVTAVLGFGLMGFETLDRHWELIPLLLLLYLSVTAWLISYCAEATATGAQYLRVFHEEREGSSIHWQQNAAEYGRLKKLRGGSGWHLNKVLAMIYFVLGAMSVVLSLSAAGWQEPRLKVLWVLVVAFFLFSLWKNLRGDYGAAAAEELWREIRQEQRRQGDSE